VFDGIDEPKGSGQMKHRLFKEQVAAIATVLNEYDLFGDLDYSVSSGCSSDLPSIAGE